MRNATLTFILLLALLLWAGMILGISFLEAPVKFTAPNITLALGLGIGRLVFGWLNKCELVFCAILLIGLLFNRAYGKAWVPAIILATILLFQTFWLLPALDVRAVQIIAGHTPPPSNLHFGYVALELLKVMLLLFTAFTVYRQQLASVRATALS
ncbi:hypothetical protein [Rufibacter sp. LB8]|uniref:hypothetical protein n=1 Tax=Rufibacter sp. LB8 TaxID=2777781 RepID=UPI00178C20CD|nr:hypothetical protein [Rufibacter sp. LB8]